MDTNYVLYLAQMLIAISVFLGVYALSPKPVEVDEDSDYVPLTNRGHIGAKRAELLERQPLYAITLPVISALGRFLSTLPLESLRVDFRNRLVQAGNPGGYSPDEFLAIPLLTGVLFPGAWVLAFYSLEYTPDPLVYPLVIAFGLMLPIIWLSDRIRQRKAAINRSLPFILDMLTLSIDAGLDFISSIERIVSKRSNQGPLSDELHQMLQELKMGNTRAEALRDLARRVNIDSLKSVVANLIQAEKLGTPLAPVLRIQSEMLRTRRSQEAEKMAMEASVKLLLPLMLIFVSVVMILLGPLGIQLMSGDVF